MGAAAGGCTAGVQPLLTLPLQLALIALIAFAMPRTPPATQAGGKRYAVVIDAGSTGSRVHSFAFQTGRGGSLDFVSDTFQQLKPGLSAHADAPAEGAASLKPLLDAALAAVPAEAHAATPVEVRATAGLRMLPGDKAEELLKGAC